MIKNFLSRFLPLPSDMPNWSKILKRKEEYKIEKSKKKKILIATSSGGHKVATSLESLIGVSLNLKGSDVEFLLCDKILNGCIMTTDSNTEENDLIEKKINICDACFNVGNKTFKKTGLKTHYLSNYITKKEINDVNNEISSIKIDKIKDFKKNDINIGEQTVANLLRYYAVGDLKLRSNSNKLLKIFFESALLTYIAIENLLSQNKYDVIVLNHGIYIPQGIIAEIAKSKKINYVTWTTGTRKNSFIFSHNQVYNKDIVSESNSNWKEIDLKNIEKKIDKYLESKVTGTQDWQYHKNEISLDVKKYFETNKIDLSKPLIGLTTNVIWDAQLHYDDTIFINMIDWIIKTIDYFSQRKDINLLIRVHPTEINSDRPAKQKVKDEIEKKYKKLPANIFLIDSNDPISTYSILNYCNALLVYGTKLGIEFAARGVPVIVAGEAVIRNKGFSIEPKSEREYFQILKSLPFSHKMSDDDINDAKKFAYHYYFKRMLELKSLEDIPYNFPPFRIKNDLLNILSNNSDKNLDLICDSILSGKEFFYKNYE